MHLSNTFFTIPEASEWASNYLDRNITPSNISYLIQYGRIKKFNQDNSTKVKAEDIKKYYDYYYNNKKVKWKKKLGSDLNWALSFDQYKEKERTKHVHRLHPYKGKFIPQLVEYFIDSHTDEFKKKIYFKKGDIILDPFCGSGTALVQANELGINAIGIDISEFNAQISNVKLGDYDLELLGKEIKEITSMFAKRIRNSSSVKFEKHLLDKLYTFNSKYFPSPEFKYKVRSKKINEWTYGKEKENDFFKIFDDLVDKYNIVVFSENGKRFLDKWFLNPVKEEINFLLELIKNTKEQELKEVLQIILSRTVRSCRATTHSDLATLKEPMTKTYYCHKHFKICKPLFSTFSWWQRYSKDTLKRLKDFTTLRTKTSQVCLVGDARNIDIFKQIESEDSEFAKIARGKKINGIFSSPPYVGLINYHEQHEYAYDLFDYKRRDQSEIGPLFKGTGVQARKDYTFGISEVLKNCKRFMIEDYDVFLVANDKHNLYPTIAEKAGMKIVNQFKRPVLNRVEKDRSAYAEIIFHLKEE